VKKLPDVTEAGFVSMFMSKQRHILASSGAFQTKLALDHYAFCRYVNVNVRRVRDWVGSIPIYQRVPI
jgi:hypothetical protein